MPATTPPIHLLPLLLVVGALCFSPTIIHTWGGAFTVAADAAHAHLLTSSLAAVQAGASACEHHQCDGTVGPDSSPDETCETTLDALLMDGTTFNVGAVGALPRIKHAVAVASLVLHHTDHSLLVGPAATRFAVEMGLHEQDISQGGSQLACAAWKNRHCQPNARVNVSPDAGVSCGPYTPRQQGNMTLSPPAAAGHDTISLVAVDAHGDMASGTSTNGRAHKMAGRVGDGPIPGSGSYVDSAVGGCGATGDGDIMMRFLPCYQAVESMRRGLSPLEAAEDAVRRMVARFPHLRAGLVVMNNKGEHAAAACGWDFAYSFRTPDMDSTMVVPVSPIHGGGHDARSEL